MKCTGVDIIIEALRIRLFYLHLKLAVEILSPVGLLCFGESFQTSAQFIVWFAGSRLMLTGIAPIKQKTHFQSVWCHVTISRYTRRTRDRDVDPILC